jgi:peptide/nickel transport system substrate-binding protein
VNLTPTTEAVHLQRRGSPAAAERGGPRRRATRLLVGLLSGALLLAACSSTPARKSSTTSTAGSVSGGAVTGGTVTVALQPGTLPNYIFPMLVPQSDTTQDIFWFIEQFWQPLYAFGADGSTAVDYAQSIAEPPVFSNGGRTVTITLKPWRWSDGAAVTTRDVEFWIDLLRANKAEYANYIPGGFPDNVTAIDYKSPTSFSLTFDKAYNREWLLYNQLSLLFPLPQQAWDKTSASGLVGNDDLTTAGAKKVWAFLNSQSTDVSTYATNPLWQVVDGPFHLAGYVPNQSFTIAPNRSYSGPVEPKLSSIEFEQFTSDAAEFNEVLSGRIDYGYVPFNDASATGQVKAEGYNVVPWEQAGMNYAIYNFSNPTTGPLFEQLYIRQALQHLVDQPAYITATLNGYGVPTYGPVPAFKPALTIDGKPVADPSQQHNPYPYSPSDAVALLRSHGWAVHPGGVDTCQAPGTGTHECGKGIALGEALRFSIIYASGIDVYKVEMTALQAAAASVGVQVDLRPESNATVLGDSGVCTPGQSCTWDVAYWYIGGWQYGMPINYPVGTLIFGCGGPYAGGYCSPTLDRLMTAATRDPGLQPLYAYERYASLNLPALWLPLQPYQLSAVSTHLGGVTPQNVQYTITPQYWYLTR